MQLQVAFGTDIGRKRQQNQDSGGAYPDMGLFVVADGMGGHRGGETASSMLVETVQEYVRSHAKELQASPAEVLFDGICQANQAIYQRSTTQAQLRGMGTTATALLLYGQNRALIAHVGDSRCYYFRPEGVWQLTRDHSLVQEKFRAGLITRAETRTDRMKNVITRSVGFEQTLDVDLYEFETHPGDVFLLCSDGLSNVVDDRALSGIVKRTVFDGRDVKRGVTELINSANEGGGDDNITAVLIQVESTS